MTGINQHSLIEQSRRTQRIEYVGEKQRLEEENLTADLTRMQLCQNHRMHLLSLPGTQWPKGSRGTFNSALKLIQAHKGSKGRYL